MSGPADPGGHQHCEPYLPLRSRKREAWNGARSIDGSSFDKSCPTISPVIAARVSPMCSTAEKVYGAAKTHRSPTGYYDAPSILARHDPTSDYTCFNGLHTRMASMVASRPPPAAVTMTTTHGGSFQKANSPSATSASPKSSGPMMALDHSGS